MEEEEYDPYNGEERPYGPLDPEVGAKGLGLAGCVPVLDDIWQRYTPVSVEWALPA